MNWRREDEVQRFNRKGKAIIRHSEKYNARLKKSLEPKGSRDRFSLEIHNIVINLVNLNTI